MTVQILKYNSSKLNLALIVNYCIRPGEIAAGRIDSAFDVAPATPVHLWWARPGDQYFRCVGPRSHSVGRSSSALLPLAYELLVGKRAAIGTMNRPLRRSLDC